MKNARSRSPESAPEVKTNWGRWIVRTCRLGLVLTVGLMGCGEPEPPPAIPVTLPVEPSTATPDSPEQRPAEGESAPPAVETGLDRHGEPEPEPESVWGERRQFTVLGLGGPPIEGALFRIELRYPEEALEGDVTFHEGRVDADGKVSLPSTDQPVRVIIRQSGYHVMIMNGEAPAESGVDFRFVGAAPDLPGRIIDQATGRPIAGARVRVWDADVHGRDRDLIQTTDAEGRFVVFGISTKRAHRIGVVADGYAVHNARIDAGERAGELEIRLGGGGTVQGVISDAEGPVAGAEVYVVAPGQIPPWIPDEWPRENLRDDLRRFLVSRAVTKKDGTYRVTGLQAPSEYVVLARAPGGAQGRTESVVSVAADETVDVALQIAPTGRIELEIAFADPASARFDDVDVTRGGDRTDVPRAYEAVRAGDSGVFVLSNVPAGRHVVFVRGRGVLDQLVTIQVAPGEIVQQTLELASGSNLTGTLLDEDGDPLVGIYVLWEFPGDDRRPSISVSDTTDGQGRFELNGLPDAAGELTARTGALELLQRADVQAGQDLGALAVKDRVRVAGQLVEELPEGTAFRAGVRWRGGRFHETKGKWPGANARPFTFEFDGVPANERVHLYLFVPGYPAWVRRNVRVKAAESLELGEIRFPTAATVTGHVLRQNGDPIAGATVWLSEPWFAGHVKADENGRFKIGPLPPGSSAFRVEIDNVPRAYQPTNLVAGSQNVTLTVKDQGEVLAVVKDGKGAAVAGLAFDFFPLKADGRPNLRRAITVTTNNNGAVIVPALVGRYGMRPSAASQRKLTKVCPPLVVEADQRFRVELTVE